MSSDDACTTIIKYSLPKANELGPYTNLLPDSSPNLGHIPSLKSLCIRRLLEYADQLHLLEHIRFLYTPPSDRNQPDLLQSLLPRYSHWGPPLDGFLKIVDPRLWAVLIQTVSPLPDALRSYTLPLSDIHLPLLQRIPSTPDFALVTILDLRGKSEVDDQTISSLGDLHGLAALNIGATAVTAYGIKVLSKTLQTTDDSVKPLRGPWGLRILSLLDCMNIDDDVFQSIPTFPLLSVVGKCWSCFPPVL